MIVQDLTSAQQFSSSVLFKNDSLIIIHFWADWSKPSISINQLLDQLSVQYQNISFFKIEAEKVPEVSEKYGVTSVPLLLFFKNGVIIDKIEGASPGLLAEKIVMYNNTPKEDLTSRLAKVINQTPVTLFMKGTPEAPKCGFSRKMVDILKNENIQFSSFDILSDQDIREGLKKYSNWPTYPQLYSNGKLIGGLDIVKELSEEGDLQNSLMSTS